MRAYEFIFEDRETLLLIITLKHPELHIDNLTNRFKEITSSNQLEELHGLIMDITKVTRMYGSTDNWYKTMLTTDPDQFALLQEYRQLLVECTKLYKQLIKDKNG
jgi:hypothetical protein